MSEALLAALNPGAIVRQARRARIMVANVETSREPLRAKAARIEIDKTAPDPRDRSIEIDTRCSRSIRSPRAAPPSLRPLAFSKSTSVAKNPTYRYNPEYAFKGVQVAARPFTIRPGPNNPVGLVWVGLSPGEGYGIHGTPDPSKDEQVGIAWLHPADQLGRAPACVGGGEGRCRRVHRRRDCAPRRPCRCASGEKPASAKVATAKRRGECARACEIGDERRAGAGDLNTAVCLRPGTELAFDEPRRYDDWVDRHAKRRPPRTTAAVSPDRSAQPVQKQGGQVPAGAGGTCGLRRTHGAAKCPDCGLAIGRPLRCGRYNPGRP